MLFKKDNMLVNEVYYDGGDVAGSLQVEDAIQKRLRLKAEAAGDKKSVVYEEYLRNVKDNELREGLILNRSIFKIIF